VQSVAALDVALGLNGVLVGLERYADQAQAVPMTHCAGMDVTKASFTGSVGYEISDEDMCLYNQLSLFEVMQLRKIASASVRHPHRIFPPTLLTPCCPDGPEVEHGAHFLILYYPVLPPRLARRCASWSQPLHPPRVKRTQVRVYNRWRDAMLRRTMDRVELPEETNTPMAFTSHTAAAFGTRD
jgi:hypothetical protein